MNEVAIIGYGMHPWGKFPGKSWEDLAAEATEKALKDAGLEWKDIQFVVAGSDPWSGHYGILAGSTLHLRLGPIGVPVVNSYNACATAGYALATVRAYVASGLCDVALCVAGSVSPKGFYGVTQMRDEFDASDVDFQRFRILGRTNPTNFACTAMRRMHLYGTTEDDLAEVKVKNSKHASFNPNTRYRNVFTKEEVLNSPMVCHPLRLYEICATSDGGAALVVCSLKKAKQYTTKPVVVGGVNLASPNYKDPGSSRGAFSTSVGDASNISDTGYSQRRAANAVYEEAGLGPGDLSLAEVYDLTPAQELDWYETIGLCEQGEAESLLREGVTAVGGRIPVNASGGVSSSGEAIPAQGFFQVCELVCQMRGEAGGRQVEGAKAGLAINSGLQGNTSCMIIKR